MDGKTKTQGEKTINLAKEILEKSDRPLKISEIYKKAMNLGLLDDLKLKGKTPDSTFGAYIYRDMKNNGDNSIFEVVMFAPVKLLKLKNQNFKKGVEIPQEIEKKTKFSELDLHPLLVKFIYENESFDAYSKTIFHQKSQKTQKGYDKWLYPDIVGVKFEKFSKTTRDFMEKFNQTRMKIFSFEIKKEILVSNFREYYFQAVSNSSWANEGYLVALNINESNDELMGLIAKSSLSFGIGVISLDSNNLAQSKILASAKFKESLDLNILDELSSKNGDFEKFIKTIRDFDIDNESRFKNEFDEVLEDEDMENYIKSKGIK